MNATKPFCLEHAKAGAPIASRDGSALRFIAHEPSATKHASVVVIVDERVIRVLCEDGRYMPAQRSQFDAVMVPLGQIDGKPVFVGDEYRMDSEQLFASPITRDFTGCRWPAPEKQYPVTLMMPHEVARASQGAACERIADFYSFANAALRHAIDSGQVVTKEDHEAALVRLGEQLRDIAIGRNPARDLAIGEAVRDACYVAVMNCSAGHEGTVVRQIKLAAIIASVPK